MLSKTQIKPRRFNLGILNAIWYIKNMPGRNIVLANENYYHVLNRGVASQKIFNCERDYLNFIGRINYYRHDNLPVSFGQFSELSLQIQTELLIGLEANDDLLVKIIAFCLMPNHFHFLLQQKKDNGISRFLSNLSNGFTRYYNIKHNRVGTLLQGRFKAVLVETDEQLVHLSRYIHLNPYSAGLVSTANELKKFPFSSLASYLWGQKGFCSSSVVLEQFNTPSDYWNFITDQADYQKNLQMSKSLLIEIPD